MELLVGAIISLITELFKWLTKKIGIKMGKAVILITVFILALIAAWFRDIGLLDQMIREWLEIGAVAIAWYEIAWKRILVKIFQEVKTR